MRATTTSASDIEGIAARRSSTAASNSDSGTAKNRFGWMASMRSTRSSKSDRHPSSLDGVVDDDAEGVEETGVGGSWRCPRRCIRPAPRRGRPPIGRSGRVGPCSPTPFGGLTGPYYILRIRTIVGMGVTPAVHGRSRPATTSPGRPRLRLDPASGRRTSLLFDAFVLGQRSRTLVGAAMAGSPLRPDEYAAYSVVFELGDGDHVRARQASRGCRSPPRPTMCGPCLPVCTSNGSPTPQTAGRVSLSLTPAGLEAHLGSEPRLRDRGRHAVARAPPRGGGHGAGHAPGAGRGGRQGAGSPRRARKPG